MFRFLCLGLSNTVDSLYLDYPLSRISRLKFSPRALHSFSLCWASLSRTFSYIEQIVLSPKPFSLSISNIYVFEFHFRIPKLIRIWIKTKISTRNEKKKIFVLSVVKTVSSMSVSVLSISVKSKLNTNTLKESP